MLKTLQQTSYLFGANAPYVEELYESYLQDPASVPDAWRAYFQQLSNLPASSGELDLRDTPHLPVIESFAHRAKHNQFVTRTCEPDLTLARKQVAVQSLIAAHRNLGLKRADLDPLRLRDKDVIPELEPAHYEFSEADLETTFSATNLHFGAESLTLREMLNSLRQTYCGSIGAEFMFVSDPAERKWLRHRMESTRATPAFTPEKKKAILANLTAAEGLERYLHTRYVGQKRFSLEGGESFIVCLDELIQAAGAQGVEEVVMGMAHRGRLNLLVNILGKMPRDLFAEFEGRHAEDLPAGDVKYHQGFSSDVTTPGGPVHLSLAFNPSHLEIVNPVVEGSARARQDRRGDSEGGRILPVLIHGDAAFAGQGVVMETLNLAQTRGYYTGGTVHIVINNQIGFTTSDPRDARSTLYCTDVVKMIEAPVFHVNGDDPEAVAFVTQVALDYRQVFKKDVVIDIVCFRKLGHNEQDTPSLTQPMMYRSIGQHPGTRRLYADKLLAQGVIEEAEADDMVKAYRAAMDEGRGTREPVLTNYKSKFAVDWAPFLDKKWTDEADTAVPLSELSRLADRITSVPDGFTLHPLVEKVVRDRRAMGHGELKLDWGMGENLAYASLVASGYAVRLTGQDCGRGTFVHRHAVLHDQNRTRADAGIYIPLEHVAEGQAPFTVIDSVLSEEAVLGFEYGYSAAEPNALVIWEAQFGDFANGAQVVIDQFIASGEVKWGRQSGLTLFLPHGHEGQGPEHSSARPERFMQLCADMNMQLCQPTTAAQIFHLLRRQMIRPFRKPLVVFTPKSLLRNKEAASDIQELATGAFQTVIGEVDTSIDAAGVKRVLACSGKVYYELVAQRRERNAQDIAIIRLEQAYPFPHKAFAAEIKKYPGLQEIVWVQDEPQNQGFWFQVQHYIREHMASGMKLGYAGRPAMASPAAGYYEKFASRQKELLETAFSKLKSPQVI